jgi:hypothetical protein
VDKNETEAEAASGNGDLGACADLAALQQCVDVTLGLRFVETILGHDLTHEVGFALERRDLLLGKVAPLRSGNIFE